MLYKTLLKLKERTGLTEDLKSKIDVFFAVGRITEEQYNTLMDITPEDIVETEEGILTEETATETTEDVPTEETEPESNTNDTV